MGSRKNGNRNGSRQEYDDFAIVDPAELPDDPDVLIAVPVVKVDEIDLEVNDLHAQVSVLAEVQELVQISVGADVRLGTVELKIEGVEAQALLKARLGNVSAILQRVQLGLDRNPELLESVGRAVEKTGRGAEQAVGQAGEAANEVGSGAGEAAEEVGQGAGEATGEVGKGANQAVGEVGQGAGEAAQGVGTGAKQATGKLAGGGS
jgi:hypothetical protein